MAVQPCSLLFALLLPLSAFAQDSRADYLRRFDTNGDGRVSEVEYVAYMSQGFHDMDSNHDGVLDAAELPGARDQPITLKEFQNNLRRQFRRLDRQHRGYLNAQELTAPPQD